MREREAGVAAERDEPLEAAFARDLQHRPGELGILLDDEDHPVALLDLPAIVAHLAREQERRVELLGERGAALLVGVHAARPGLDERGQVQRERAPLARRRDDPDLAAEEARDLPADRKPEPGAAVAAAGRPVRLLEGLEDDAQLVLGDPDPRVDDREGDDGLGGREALAREADVVSRDADLEPHRALVGELDRVREQVLQDLLEPLLVGDDRRRDVRADHLHRELERLLLRERPERPLSELAHVGELELGGLDLHLPRLDLRQVEDVVDQVEEVAARGVDRPRVLHLLLAQVLVGVLREQLREDEQRVERRPQLVGHVREELGLVPGREGELLGLLLERCPRQLHLAVLDLDAGVLLGEELRLLLQLLVRLLELLLLRLELLLPLLQLERQALRLLEQLLGAHVLRDHVEDDADPLLELVEERLVHLAEAAERRELEYRHHEALEEDRHDDDVVRRGLAEPGRDPDVVLGRLGQQDRRLLERRLPDEPLAELERVRDALPLLVREARD